MFTLNSFRLLAVDLEVTIKGIIAIIFLIALATYWIYTSKKSNERLNEKIRETKEWEKEWAKTHLIKDKNLVTCKDCRKEVSAWAVKCVHCGAPMPRRCPKCGSYSIRNISGTKKGASAWALGTFAANTVLNDFECLACKNKFK